MASHDKTEKKSQNEEQNNISTASRRKGKDKLNDGYFACTKLGGFQH